MYYELSIKVNAVDSKGVEKQISESYIADVNLFSEAELAGLNECNNEGDVFAIKRSNIIEFVNKRDDDNQKIFRARIVTTTIDDKGKEKETSYHVGVFASSLDNANSLLIDYMKQGLDDMRLNGINETKLLNII